MSDTAIIIPARFNSSRLPGKPLAIIAGKTMLERVWLNACAALKDKSLVLIATDDERIRSAAEAFGANVIMTPAICENGSERVNVASKNLNETVKFIINLQGDAPLTPPSLIEGLIALRRISDADISTVCVALSDAERTRVIDNSEKWGAGTYVVFNEKKLALYFSRYPIPFARDDKTQLGKQTAPLYKHVGIYGYTRASLARYAALPESKLEALEKLEQLRALEAGMTIAVQECTLYGRSLVSVDTPDDLVRAAQVIASEGELV